MVAVDADTGKPLDPRVGVPTQRDFITVEKDKHGKKMLVAHKGDPANATYEFVKNDNGGANGNGGEEKKKDGTGGGGDIVSFHCPKLTVR